MKGDLQALLYNPTGIFNISKEFFETGIKAANHHFQKEEIARGTDINTIKLVPVPATNLSFSLELSLKGIHMLKLNNVPKTHSLLKLFNDLPTEIKELIQSKSHKEKYSEYFIIDFGDDSNRQFEPKASFITGSMEEIIANLELQDNSFVDFRYFFEIGLKEKTIYFNYKFMANMAHNTLEVLHSLILANQK